MWRPANLRALASRKTLLLAVAALTTLPASVQDWRQQYPELRCRSPARSIRAPAEIEALRQAVERNCPILNLLHQPQAIAGAINLRSV